MSNAKGMTINEASAMAEKAMKAGRLEIAENIFGQIATAIPGNAFVLWKLINVQILRKRYAEAAITAAQMVDVAPLDGMTYRALRKLPPANGQLWPTREKIAELARSPDPIWACQHLVSTLIRQDLLDNALERLKGLLTSLSFEDEQSRAVVDQRICQIGAALWNKRHYGPLADKLIELETQHPFWPEAWRYAMSRYLENDLTAAESAIAIIADRYPVWDVAAAYLAVVRSRIDAQRTMPRSSALPVLRQIRTARYGVHGNPKDEATRQISLLMPTRGRIAGATTLIESAYRSAQYPELVEILSYVDEDDPEQGNYVQLFSSLERQLPGCSLVLLNGPRIALSRAWNMLAREGSGQILVVANDDQEFVSRGWDACLQRAVSCAPDGIYCAWFNDGAGNTAYGDFPIFSRRLFNSLGYFTPEFLQFQCNDQWAWDISARLGRLIHVADATVLHQRTWLDNQNGLNKIELVRRQTLSDRDSFFFYRTTIGRRADADFLRRLIRTPGPDQGTVRDC